MSDDDEYCDLETLEALLETDECDKESPTLNSKNDFSKEMEEFLNSMPEESDDETDCGDQMNRVANHEKKQITNKSSDNTPTLDVKTACKKSSMLTSDLQGAGKTSKGKDSHKNVKPLPEADRKPTENADGALGGICENVSTLALQRELLEMQKKMAEMQKMLLEQQNKNVRDNTESPVVNQKKKSPSQSESQSSSTKDTSAKKLRLIADDEENPFIDKREASRLPAEKCKKSDKKEVASEVTRSKSKGLTSKELFGDSDSDWDELDGEKTSNLSEQGKSIKRLLHGGGRDRQAHKTNFVVDDKPTHQTSKSWTERFPGESSQKPESHFSKGKEDKFSLKCKSSSSDQIKSVSNNNAAPSEKLVTEDFSRIRIVNPLISSAVMKMRMEGRKLVNISNIHLKLNTADLQSDWVTIGVMVGKVNAKTSNSGKTYTIWKLNDLHDLDNSVSFFLFGEVYKAHWKMDVGCVIGLLNPSMMEAMEKGKSEPAFTIKNPNQLMVLGQSKDLSWCTARTKKGNKCSHFVNKKQGDFCSYHVQSEYRKTSAKRLELQGSVTGIKPKSFEQKIFSKDCAYMYGGRAFLPHSSNAKSKSSVTISKLQKSSNSAHRINTLSIQNLKMSKSGQAGGKGRITEEKDQLFMDLLTVPSPGAMNLVAHLKHNEDDSKSPTPAAKSAKQRDIQSVTARDLLKQHKLTMRHKQVEKRKASDLLLASGDKPCEKRVSSSSNPLKEVPTLGKGISRGQDISFSTSPPTKKSFTVADMSKLKALSVVQNKGGISKEDPNAVRKEMEPKRRDAIQKQLEQAKAKRSSSSPRASSSEEEPPKKRSRLLGDIDLNSSEVKAILKAKSKHKGALAEAETEREETYFSELQKKEQMEEKMQSVTSIEINVFTCKQCKYTAQSALGQCKTDNHTIVKTKAKKRFFACKKCKERTTTITSKFPTDPCRKCGSLCYDKTSMYKEKTGPKLESEILSLRGDEMKFLNSLDHKVYMNTVVDK